MDNTAQWYIDGRWVHPHEATISINDTAILRAYSVGSIFNDGQPEILRDPVDRIHVARMAAIVDGNNSLNATPIALKDKRPIACLTNALTFEECL